MFENILRYMGHSTLHQRAWFLAKTDPETYSIEQLARDKQTVWDGVKNPQALRAIREMRTGDRVFIYHSQGEAAIVGIAEVVADGRPAPKAPKLAVADLRFAGRIEPRSPSARSKSLKNFPTGLWSGKAASPR